jgi:hypothetical protein
MLITFKLKSHISTHVAVHWTDKKPHFMIKNVVYHTFTIRQAIGSFFFDMTEENYLNLTEKTIWPQLFSQLADNLHSC